MLGFLHLCILQINEFIWEWVPEGAMLVCIPSLNQAKLFVFELYGVRFAASPRLSIQFNRAIHYNVPGILQVIFQLVHYLFGMGHYWKCIAYMIMSSSQGAWCAEGCFGTQPGGRKCTRGIWWNYHSLSVLMICEITTPNVGSKSSMQLKCSGRVIKIANMLCLFFFLNLVQV